MIFLPSSGSPSAASPCKWCPALTSPIDPLLLRLPKPPPLSFLMFVTDVAPPLALFPPTAAAIAATAAAVDTAAAAAAAAGDCTDGTPAADMDMDDGVVTEGE